MSRRPRVLVVDDSAFTRKVVREVLASDGRLEVVGFARDGLDALEKISELAPDVVTLDLVMPDLDGAGVVEALRASASPPRVVLVTTSAAESAIAVRALQAGAFDLVRKPTALATERLYEIRDELVTKVLAAAAAPSFAGPHPAPLRVAATARPPSKRVVVIGTSTGGPRALTALLASLDRSFPVPIVVVVHMPPGFTGGLAARLDADCALDVAEAVEQQIVPAGAVAIGRAGQNLRVQSRQGAVVTLVGGGPAGGLHHPSADVLFASAAEVFGADVLGVVLTGMGNDGLEGSASIRTAGGEVLVEDASTCVVHGMPRVVAEAGLASAVVPLGAMAEAIVARL